MDYKMFGGKGEEKLDRLLKEIVFNSANAPASGFSAQRFIKQVLLPLFPHSSWGESSWPCSFNDEVLAFLVLHRNLSVSMPVDLQHPESIQITDPVLWLFGREGLSCFLGQMFIFFSPLGVWWCLLGGHREAALNLASKKGSYFFGGEEVSSQVWGALLLVLKSSFMIFIIAKNSKKDKSGKYDIFLNVH